VSVLDRLGDGPGKRWLAKHLDHDDKEFCLIWPFRLASNGYAQVGGDRHIPHRLMCEHRHGPAPSDEHQAAHSCGNGDRGCVNQWHLNWRTPAGNQLERYEHSGLIARAKLTPEQAEEIRSVKGKEVITWTAARFGVTEANIRQIQSGKTWGPGSTRRRPLTEDEVRLIRSTPIRDKTARQFAKELGVSMGAIEHVRCGNTYKWVTESAEPALMVASQARGDAT
jgi:hypothetical protein